MKRRKNLQLLMTSLICGSLLAGSQVGSAEELVPTFQLDEIVVTATRTLKQIQEVPASISVVTAKDIKEKNVTTVRDAIAQMPGVYMDMAGNSGITLRGFSSTDILVLVDGQQMNSTYNSVVNFNEIPVENVERIEVLRGAASPIYAVMQWVVLLILPLRKQEITVCTAMLHYPTEATRHGKKPCI